MTALLLTRELSDLQDVIANNIRGYRSRDDLKKKIPFQKWLYLSHLDRESRSSWNASTSFFVWVTMSTWRQKPSWSLQLFPLTPWKPSNVCAQLLNCFNEVPLILMGQKDGWFTPDVHKGHLGIALLDT